MSHSNNISDILKKPSSQNNNVSYSYSPAEEPQADEQMDEKQETISDVQ